MVDRFKGQYEGDVVNESPKVNGGVFVLRKAALLASASIGAVLSSCSPYEEGHVQAASNAPRVLSEPVLRTTPEGRTYAITRMNDPFVMGGYQVQSGDTLSSIVQDIYGRTLSVAGAYAIYQEFVLDSNSSLKESPNSLRVGETLVLIPPARLHYLVSKAEREEALVQQEF